MSSPSLNHFIPIQSNLQCVSWNILQWEPRQSSQVSWPSSNGATPATLQPIGSLANPHTLIQKRQWDCMRIDCESKYLFLSFSTRIFIWTNVLTESELITVMWLTLTLWSMEQWTTYGRQHWAPVADTGLAAVYFDSLCRHFLQFLKKKINLDKNFKDSSTIESTEQSCYEGYFKKFLKKWKIENPNW